MRRVSPFVTQVATASLVLIMAVSNMMMAGAILTDPDGINPLMSTWPTDWWGIAIGGFGVMMGIGLGLAWWGLIALMSLLSSLWYFTIMLLVGYDANAGERPWSSPVMLLTIALVFTMLGAHSLRPFTVQEDQEDQDVVP